MKTLILSRLALMAVLFAVFVFAAHKTEISDLSGSVPVTASSSPQTANVAAVSVSDFSQTANVRSAFDNDNAIYTERLTADTRKRILPERNYTLQVKQSLFDTPLFKPNIGASRINFNVAASRRPNKSSPLMQ